MNVKQLLEKSNAISLVLPSEAPENDTQEALLLACGLKKLGKRVSIENTLTTLPASPSQEKTFVVSLKGLAPWVARVRYEKDAEDLKLYFTLNQRDIPSEALSLQIQSQADLTIIIGNRIPQNNDNQPTDLPVLSAGETKKPLLDLLCSQKDGEARLLGMVLSRMEYAARVDTYIILLREEDFQHMQADPKNLPVLVSELRKSFGDQPSYLFLLDSPLGAQGVLWSASPQLRLKFRDIAGGQERGPWVLLHPTPFASEQLKYAFLS